MALKKNTYVNSKTVKRSTPPKLPFVVMKKEYMINMCKISEKEFQLPDFFISALFLTSIFLKYQRNKHKLQLKASESDMQI
jgi:hypothetical protein